MKTGTSEDLGDLLFSYVASQDNARMKGQEAA
jgi:hypothetical protein